ncbi:MAG TPA: NAD(P)-binding domain-containing protein [Bryobacteraceae bacterium]|nr:NAD(P)-binding domain-containing protein [Bryobacteraceae bacterium]
MLELIFLEGGQTGQSIRLNFDRAWFGRQPTCDFVLQGGGISRVHFCIERRGEDFVLVDNRSTNGTFVNGLRTELATLRPGDDIQAGTNRIQVREISASSTESFRFVAQHAGETASQVVEQSTILLGRKSICAIQLNDPAVAAVHAQIEYRDGGLWITDESSGAGIYVNGQRVVHQQLQQGDVVTIRPFEIAVSLTEEMCFLAIHDSMAELQEAPMQVPGQYREVVVAPQHAEAGQAKPSAAIAALPRWMQAKAPIWVPTSDILPNRFRTVMLSIFVLGVLGWAGMAFAKKWNTAYSPGPLTENHAAFGCDSCHSSFARVPASSCQGCHADTVATAIHQQHNVTCVNCHSEHRGAKFDIARNVGAGCQSAGCHVTVHAAEKQILAKQGPPQPGLVVPAAVALAVPFEAGDAMHDKHANLAAACAACHTGGDPTLAVSDQAAVRTKELKDIRMRCLGCHGFGPQATLRQRCYSCHLEHPSDKAAVTQILTPRRFPPAPPARPRLASLGSSGLLIFFGAVVAVPLFFVTATAGNLRVSYGKFRAEIEKRVRSSPPVKPPVAAAPTESVAAATTVADAAAPKPTDNQAPGGNLRPRINIDLCVGCGTCVHVCPFNVLEIVNEKAIAARLEDCTGFAACAAECPTEAIVLVAGGAMQTVELPVYGDGLETNVPGMYLAGEVTGKALIKVAINQGKKVVESILQSPLERGKLPYDVIVVGAGPAGTSAALAAKAEGLNVLVLEQGNQGNTIRNYPRQKFVMAEPVMIPLYGPLWMEDTSKEALLERWQEIISKTDLVIQEEEKVLRVVHHPDHFAVQSSKGEYQGARVVLSIGKRGSPRKLGVPGEDSSKVAYNLMDADAYRGKAICIVGGGDSGIEAACGLGRADLQNKVWVVHRTEDFSRAKPRNQKKIKKAMDEGRIKAFFTSGVNEIREKSILVQTAAGVEEIENDFVFVMVGGENPKKFLTECGIEFSQRPLG